MLNLCSLRARFNDVWLNFTVPSLQLILGIATSKNCAPLLYNFGSLTLLVIFEISNTIWLSRLLQRTSGARRSPAWSRSWTTTARSWTSSDRRCPRKTSSLRSWKRGSPTSGCVFREKKFRRKNFIDYFFVGLACHSPVLDGFDWNFQASVHFTLSSNVNKSQWHWKIPEKIFGECRKSNPGLLGEKQESLISAMQPQSFLIT